MNHLQQDLGALELGAIVAGQVDAALENAGRQTLGPPTHFNPVPGCHFIENGALEASALHLGGPRTGPFSPFCHHIDDGALEAMGKDTAAGTSRVHDAVTRCA